MRKFDVGLQLVSMCGWYCIYTRHTGSASAYRKTTLVSVCLFMMTSCLPVRRHGHVTQVSAGAAITHLIAAVCAALRAV